MPAGTSVVGKAKAMTLSFSAGLKQIIGSKQEHLKHLESRRNHLLALFGDSDQPEARQMVEEVNLSIQVLKESIPELEQADKKSVEIEARL